MTKKFFLSIIFLIFPIYLFANPSFVLNGPFGGKAEIACGDFHQISGNDSGGSCSIYYVDYSTIPNWKFVGGPLEIGFSLLYSTNELWIDFSGVSQPLRLINEKTETSYNIEIPEPFSFRCNLKTFNCDKVVKFNGEGEPIIKINGTEYKVSPSYLQYFLKIPK